ncbi:MAG: glutaredoxin [Clostridia bacterium]|jgi:glutaredoxin-like YruB-family protein|nr:glutaredoxin [Clostridia bacterium]
MRKVEIYTSETCSYCHAAKDFLREHNIGFHERNITVDTKARKELISMGYRSVPVIIVDGEEISGFDKERLAKLLKL